METVIKRKIKPEERYSYFLRIISSFVEKGLSETEIQILDAIYVEGDGKLSPEVRIAICEQLGKKDTPMSAYNLNNYIGKLRKKKLIVGDNLTPVLMITIPKNEVFEIKIILNPLK